jgi:hypothetical protein
MQVLAAAGAELGPMVLMGIMAAQQHLAFLVLAVGMVMRYRMIAAAAAAAVALHLCRTGLQLRWCPCWLFGDTWCPFARELHSTFDSCRGSRLDRGNQMKVDPYSHCRPLSVSEDHV